MTEQELLERLRRFLPAMLDVVQAKLGLDAGLLPPSEAPVARRATEILTLVKQADGGLQALEIAVKELIGPPMAMSRKQCVMILAANPVDSDPLRLGDELRVIRDSMRGGDGKSYRIEYESAVSSNDLQRCLQEYKPTVVHFSGHGTEHGEIVLQDAGGKAEAVPGHALVDLFKILGGTEAVVLNACYTEAQATALASVVPNVIGMSREIGDDDAMKFAAGFYGGLAFEKDYLRAFRLGCNRIALAALPDAAVPRFKHAGKTIPGR